MRTGLRRFEAALAMVGEEPSRGRAFLLGAVAAYEQLIGDLRHAAERAAQAEEMFASFDDLIGTRTAIGMRGDIAKDLGELDQARDHYARAWPLVEAAPDDAVLGYWHGNVGIIALRGGDLVTARAELDQARDHFGRAPAWYLGRVLDQLGSIARLEGRVDEAAPLLAEAVEILRRYGAVNEAIHCFEELGRVALARQDPRRAAVLFGAATGFRESTARTISPADRKALARDLDRTRSELPRSSFADAWARGLTMSFAEASDFARSTARGLADGPSASRGPTLTPREHEIAQLVALGMTNRQIADQLVVSSGTVRIHVERILGKLGLTSRVQVATWVVGQHQLTGVPVSQAS
jgi:non-specific serine/threonine protein kinase